jgi:hypothetical protein
MLIAGDSDATLGRRGYDTSPIRIRGWVMPYIGAGCAVAMVLECDCIVVIYLMVPDRF